MIRGKRIKKADTTMIESMLNAGGEMGELIHTLDWSNHSLGPLESWPQSLRTSLGVCLFSKFPILILWGQELTMLYNDAFSSILGKDKHPSALGQRGEKALKEIWPIINPMLQGVVGESKATYSDDMMLPLDGSGIPEERYFTFSYSPIWDEVGAVGGVFMAVTETTPRVLLERRLRSLGELSETTNMGKTVGEVCQLAASALVNDQADLPFALIYLIDSKGNQARLMGYSGTEAGLPISPTAIDRSNSMTWPIDEILNGDGCIEINDLQIRFSFVPDGTWPEPISKALALPIQAQGKEKVLGFLVAGISPRLEMDTAYETYLTLITDQVGKAITNAQAREVETEKAEALSQLDEAKTAFFNNISHEFRTPLTLMIGPIEDLVGGLAGELNPEQEEALGLVQRNSRRLMRLVNNLLDFSRMETKRVESDFEPTDLAAMTSDLASMFRSAVERAGMHFILDIPHLSQPIYVDQEMWEKIILNLLSNAFKFTFEGEIAVSLHETADTIQLTIRDTGIGIPPENLPHIFERFYHGEDSRARTQEGSGIGLALVHDLVKLHGGTVEVESQIDVGTIFTVTLPKGHRHLPQDRIQTQRLLQSTSTGAVPYIEETLNWLPDEVHADSDDWAMSKDDTQDIQAATKEIRIVLADDNADMRAYLTHLLEAFWAVEAFPNGEEALTNIRDNPPDLVLTDVMMPNMDGFGLLRALRDDPVTRTLPVILLSARAGEVATVEGLAAGADDYLIKPFAARELIARIRTQLQMAQLRQASERQVQTVLENMPIMLVAVDENDEYIVWNRECERVTGYKATEMLHNPEAAKKLFPDAQYREQRWEFYRTNRTVQNREWEMSMTSADGSKRNTLWWNISSQYPIPGWASWSVGVDISDRTLAEKQAVELAAHQERQRLARDLHDSVTQTLFASASIGESLARLWDRQPQRTRKLLDQVVQLNRSALAEMRVLLLELRPEAIYARPLRELLQNLIDAAKGFAEFNAELIVEGRERTLPPDVQMMMYRIAQESINNIIKHSEANTFLVRYRQESDAIQLQISDNGRGFDESQVSEGIGLGSMRERADAVDATLEVESELGKGTTITVVKKFAAEATGV